MLSRPAAPKRGSRFWRRRWHRGRARRFALSSRRRNAQGRAIAVGARRNGRRHDERAPRRATVFLVCRSCFAGGGDLGRDADARGADAECATVKREFTVAKAPEHLPEPARGASGRYAANGIAKRKISIRRGSRSFSTILSKRSRRGRRCMKSCAINRATCSSTPWDSAKTIKN